MTYFTVPFKANFIFLVKFFCVAVLLLLMGCGAIKNLATSESYCESQHAEEGATSVSLFLNLHRQDARLGLKVKINSIELLVDDSWLPVLTDVVEVNTTDTLFFQRFLCRQWIKGRSCRGIRVKVAGATLSQGHGERSLDILNSETEIKLPTPVELGGGSRKVLFIEWNPQKSVSEMGFEGMYLAAFGSGVDRISANLAYVACPEIDTVYVVSTDKFQVVDAFAVNGKPTYLSADLDSKKIYVLASSLDRIIPYDISTHLPGTEIQIPLAISSSFMTVNNRSHTGYVSDAQGVVTSIDLVSGNMLRRNRVGNRPNYLYYIPGSEQLAVSSPFDQAVYLVNPDTLIVENNIKLGSVSLGLVSWENYLYITEASTSTVSVYDLTARKMVKNIHVGFEPTRLVTSDNIIYATNFLDGTVSIIQGGQFSVSKELIVGKGPKEMAVAKKQRLLFVGMGDCDGSLAVIDTTGNNVIGRIELGARPLGIVVVE